MTNVCVNCGTMKWKGEAPGMCCPPGEAGRWSLYIYKGEVSVCLSVCLCVHPYDRFSKMASPISAEFGSLTPNSFRSKVRP